MAIDKDSSERDILIEISRNRNEIETIDRQITNLSQKRSLIENQISYLKIILDFIVAESEEANQSE